MADQQSPQIVAAADASFLIGLGLLDQIALLEAMSERIYVAEAVWEEVVIRGRGRPGAERIEQATFLIRQSVQNRQAVAMLQLFLGPGEAETLALAQELSCPLVLMDDFRARKAAQQAGIRALGIVGFLLAAKKRGLIGAIRPPLEMLLAHDFHLGKNLVEAALREAVETF